MHGIIFDTETTGLIKFKKPDTDPSQPCIVQLGVQFVDIDPKTDKLVKTGHYETLASNPWIKVEPEAAEVTGITDEKLAGAPHIINVMQDFMSHVEKSDFIVAHNMAFDFRMVKVSCCHINRERHVIDWEALTELKKYCTMLTTTPILKLPGRFGNYKWPKLEECYQHYFGKSISGAHDAMVDVDATFDVINEIGFSNLVEA